MIKDTHREKALLNKTPALTKSRNMSIWMVGTSNQGSYTEIKLKKKQIKLLLAKVWSL